MFRTRTALVIGSGAGIELELPDRAELLGKVAQGFDFGRLGSDLQTPDMIALAHHFESLAGSLGTSTIRLLDAGGTIRSAARVSPSLDTILDQFADDELVKAAGKLALAHYVLQAEARSPLGVEPRDPGDLPLRGNENWLFQLARCIVSGVPRSQAESAFDNLQIISFTHDRALEHYLPWVVQLAFGMTLSEARRLVGERLDIVHPLGTVGRLPWQPGEGPDAEWACDDAWNIHALAGELRIPHEVAEQPLAKQQLVARMAGADRLVFLGFGFEPQYTSLLFNTPLGHDPDILISSAGMGDPTKAAVLRIVKRLTGVDRPDLVTLSDARPYQMLRDHALLLES